MQKRIPLDVLMIGIGLVGIFAGLLVLRRNIIDIAVFADEVRQ